jgi:uncharacterized protein
MNAAALAATTMSIKFLRKYLPDPDEVRAHRWIAMFGGLLNHPNLWQLNRSSVSGAVAIGLFAGLIPGPLQMVGAALLAVPLRKNLPVALIMTLYTNPFTIVPLYLLAYAYGKLLLGERDDGLLVQPFDFDWSSFLDSMQGLFGWMLSLGKPLAVGLPALGLTLAVLGYIAVRLGWRIYIVLAWRARCRRRQAQARS